jgi:hypothetical protein
MFYHFDAQDEIEAAVGKWYTSLGIPLAYFNSACKRSLGKRCKLDPNDLVALRLAE